MVLLLLKCLWTTASVIQTWQKFLLINFQCAPIQLCCLSQNIKLQIYNINQSEKLWSLARLPLGKNSFSVTPYFLLVISDITSYTILPLKMITILYAPTNLFSIGNLRSQKSWNVISEKGSLYAVLIIFSIGNLKSHKLCNITTVKDTPYVVPSLFFIGNLRSQKV